MLEMRTIVIDDLGRLSVYLSCVSTRLRCANTAVRIEILLEVETLGDPGTLY